MFRFITTSSHCVELITSVSDRISLGSSSFTFYFWVVVCVCGCFVIWKWKHDSMAELRSGTFLLYHLLCHDYETTLNENLEVPSISHGHNCIEFVLREVSATPSFHIISHWIESCYLILHACPASSLLCGVKAAKSLFT